MGVVPMLLELKGIFCDLKYPTAPLMFLFFSFFQDDTYTESYISTIGVDFVSILFPLYGMKFLYLL